MNKIKSYLTRAIKNIKLIRGRDIWDLLVTLISAPIGLVLRLFKKDIWIISEMEHTARDNGYHLFKYVRENYPQKNVYYPIQFTSPDYKKVAKLGNVIKHGSFLHHIYTWAAVADISTRNSRGLPTRLISRLFLINGLFPFKEIFLQHGVIMNTLPFLDSSRNKIDLFFASTEKEADAIAKDMHYNRDMVKVTGLARYDELNDYKVNKKQILLMPTWRLWLYPDLGVEKKDTFSNIKNSNYVKTYCSLLKNERLNAFLEQNDLTLLFFPHNQMQPFLKAFTGENERIKIADTQNYDVATALKESAYLITDYSSIIFDFAYMKKPMCLYQFDYDEFRQKHYPEGYFSYKNDGFGDIVKTEDELVDNLITSYNNGFKMQDEYINRVDKTFKFKDNNNCKRNYDAIVEFLDKK